MDSKLKGKVVAVAVVMVLLVVATVFGADYYKKQQSRAAREQASMELTDSTTASAADAAETSAMTATDNTAGGNDLYSRYNLDPTKDPYAYLKDDDFFDPVKDENDPATELTLLVSSVEKDLRVNVIDGLGRLVSGQDFSISVKDSNGRTHNYRDGDKDGSVYIAPVEPGDYQVSLKGADQYVLADASDVEISVKEQLDYTVIDDISFMIKSEAQVDASKEDTAINEAELDSDGTESNERLDDEDALFGIDVSKWNKEIDWEKVAASGVEFAVIRCGYRGASTGALVEDPYFKKNIEGAQAAGIKVGILRKI